MFNEYPYRNLSDINLDFILKKVKDCISKIETIDGYIEKHQPEYEELKKLYDDLLAGKFPPEFIKSLNSWLDHNAIDIIGELSTHVFFGLTDTGYFVAYIPESWKDITFNTSDYDISLSDRPDIDYGHLILSY